MSIDEKAHHRTLHQREKNMNEPLILKNYKEPLKPIIGGYGYYGAIRVTSDGHGIECHICGKVFENLGGHINYAHKMKGKEYKDKFELSHSTALISESFRARLKQRTVEWVASLTDEEKQEFKNKCKEANRRFWEMRKNQPFNQPKGALEQKNKRGACPQQLLEKIKEIAKKVGHTPSLAEFVAACGGQRYKHLIIATYGSWLKAVDMAGLKPKEKYVQTGHRDRYDDEELLEHLVIFYETHGVLPTYTDAKRGLIPAGETYLARFGGIPKARALAGLPEMEKPKTRKYIQY